MALHAHSLVLCILEVARHNNQTIVCRLGLVLRLLPLLPLKLELALHVDFECLVLGRCIFELNVSAVVQLPASHLVDALSAGQD